MLLTENGPATRRFGVRTASKIGWRELRASPAKFLFVIIAVAVGVAALSGVKGFGQAVKGMLLKNEKQLIAADVQAQTFRLPTPGEITQVQAIARRFGSVTRVTEVVSMSASQHAPVPQMVSVKAVEPSVYPFYGNLKTRPMRPLSELLSDDSSVVVSPELEVRLKVRPGDSIRLGGQEFRITGELMSEPDRLASGFGPGMRVLMSRRRTRSNGFDSVWKPRCAAFLVQAQAPSKSGSHQGGIEICVPACLHQ